MVSIQGSKCQNCDTIIEDLAKALFTGCPSCHSRSFKFIKRSLTQAEPLESSLNDLVNDKSNHGLGIGIKMIERGKFEFDLKALADNTNIHDPIVVQDLRGIINIIIDPEE